MNPRVSRSSALASKATGFPIAKIAARLAVGYTLDEIDNDITRKTPACFEPTLDYVVVKMPRWAFEKFPLSDRELTTHMKSVGEAMAIGRTFKEAFQKAMRSRELDAPSDLPGSAPEIRKALAIPTAERYELVLHAFRQKLTVDEVHELTGISPFFLSELADIVELEREVREAQRFTPELLRRMKRYGFSDKRLGELTGRGEREIRALRVEHDVIPVYKAVDTCAAEFQAETPYFYSTYEQENEAEPGDKERVVILGSGPNRIGQGIEFDYCCVHAALTARERATRPSWSTATRRRSARLRHLRPPLLRAADVRGRRQHRRQRAAQGRDRAVRRPDATQDRPRARRGRHPHPGHAPGVHRPRRGPRALRRPARGTGHPMPEYGLASTAEQAAEVAARVGYPLLVRPSSCSAGGPCRSSTARRSSSTTCRPRSAPAPSTRCSSTSSSRTRSRWTWTRSVTAKTCTSAPSCSTWRRPGCAPATRPASYRPSRSARAHSSRCASRPAPWPWASVCAGSSTCSSPTRAISCTCSR